MLDNDGKKIIKNLEWNDKTRFLFEIGKFQEIQEWQNVDIQIMKCWKRNHQIYWKFSVNEQTLDDVVNNFYQNKRWVDIAIDENHEPEHKALWWVRQVYKKAQDNLFATIELTKKWAEVLSQWLYKYFSPEIARKRTDEESWENYKNLLIGGAFTNRPFFKNMTWLMASEVSEDDKNNLYILPFNEKKEMNKFKELLEKLSKETKISAEKFSELKKCFSELPVEEQTEEAKTQVSEVEAKVEKADEKKADEDKGDNEDKKEYSEKVVISKQEFSEFKNLASIVSRLTADARKREVADKVANMQFSESNKESVILPKHKDKVVEFACKLSEEQAEKFFEIIKDFKNIAEKFEENWTDKSDTGEFADKKMQDKVMEMANKFMKDDKMDPGEAYKKAMKACGMNK